MNYIKQLGINALYGIIAGGIVDICSWLFRTDRRNKRKIELNRFSKYIVGDGICLNDVKHLHLYFDFDTHYVVDNDTGEILLDFNGARHPSSEMADLLAILDR